MLTICQERYACQIHKVDVLRDGIFDRPNEKDRTRQITADPAVVQAFWDDIQNPVSDMLYPMSQIRI